MDHEQGECLPGDGGAHGARQGAIEEVVLCPAFVAASQTRRPAIGAIEYPVGHLREIAGMGAQRSLLPLFESFLQQAFLRHGPNSPMNSLRPDAAVFPFAARDGTPGNFRWRGAAVCLAHQQQTDAATALACGAQQGLTTLFGSSAAAKCGPGLRVQIEPVVVSADGKALIVIAADKPLFVKCATNGCAQIVTPDFSFCCKFGIAELSGNASQRVKRPGGHAAVHHRLALAFGTDCREIVVPVAFKDEDETVPTHADALGDPLKCALRVIPQIGFTLREPGELVVETGSIARGFEIFAERHQKPYLGVGVALVIGDVEAVGCVVVVFWDVAALHLHPGQPVDRAFGERRFKVGENEGVPGSFANGVSKVGGRVVGIGE